MHNPEIYIANLTAYNSGCMRGAWITPSADADEVAAEIIAAIGGNAGDEWAIHDFNNFPDLGENPEVAAIAKVVGMLEAHAHEAVLAAFDAAGGVDEAEELLDNGWRVFACHEEQALAEYAEECVDEGMFPPAFLLQYVDFERLGRDLGYDMQVITRGGTTYIFNR